MKENRTVFHFLTETLTVFSYTILILNLLALEVGEDAKNISTIFSMGSKGISAKTTFQFLISSAALTGLRFLIFGDSPKLQLPFWCRSLCMLVSSLLVLTAFILVFGWFPAKEWTYWALFLICFLLSCAGTVLLTVLKERSENKQMENALKKYQRGENL